MSEHTVAIVSFEGALKREIKRIRKMLQADESLHQFDLRVEISGRCHDGDIDLAYSLGENSYSTRVSANTIHATVDEFLRRRGWQALNAPKAIGYEKIPSDDTDEIPF